MLLPAAGAAVFQFRKSGIGNFVRFWDIDKGHGHVGGKRQEHNGKIYIGVPTGGAIGIELGTGDKRVVHDMREEEELVVNTVDREHTRTILPGTTRFDHDGTFDLDEHTKIRFMGGVGNETFKRRFLHQLFRDGLV